jgi:uncharacterized delta-60 repeat protein
MNKTTPTTFGITLAGVLALIVLSTNGQAAPGNLDLAFGGTGKVTTGSGFGNGLVVQSDGKIVVAGNSGSESGGPDFGLVRFNTDGSLDITFGGTGKVTTDFGKNEYGESVAVQSDGKILVAGVSQKGANTSFAIGRYLADGSLDTSFGGTGKVTTDFGSLINYANSVIVQSDGKIIVAGYSGNDPHYDFALVRYNTDGSLDASFGGTGKVKTTIGSNAIGESVAVQSDGKIVVAGYADIGGSIDFALVRYLTDGSLDTSLGGTDKVTTAIGSDTDSGRSVAVQSDGKIVVAGQTYIVGSDNAIALVRYLADGSLDTTLGGTGKVTTFIAHGDNPQSVAIQSNGKIIVAGGAYIAGGSEFALVRYLEDGGLDTTFGGTGEVTTVIGSSADAYGVAVQSDGMIVAAGGSQFGLAVVRYQGDSVPEPSSATLLIGSGMMLGLRRRR